MRGKAEYHHLEKRPDKESRELFVRGRGIRCSTIWHDRYVSRFPPAQIAKDRDIPVEAVYEALGYCEENWETICMEKDIERKRLEEEGLLEAPG
jgi:uncharacterized protein (DUF433 family)